MNQTSKTLYMIGNAHIDPVWLWQWQDGFHEAKATFRSALDRMNEYPDFVFTASQAAVYEWVETNEPDLFAEIQQRVTEGRWQIVGGWWVEPDCNIPAGESFVRQGLLGQGYFRKKFGRQAVTGYCIDSFGHNAMLPQILQKSGMLYYVFMRPAPHEKDLPGRVFWWQATDGSRVLAYRIPGPYCTWGRELHEHVRSVAAELDTSPGALMCFYGVGNHGGGPTVENIESIHAMQGDEQFPPMVFSGPDEYFHHQEQTNRSYPVVRGDLQHHASGCYSAHSGVKRWNRAAENRLLAAEKWSAAAHQVTGLPYPADFERAWKNVCFNQFHDILAGTSHACAYEDAREQYGEALSIAGRALNAAVQSLAWKIDIQPEHGLIPIAVFNPHTWRVRTCIEVELSRPEGGVILLDSAHNSIPFQFVRSQATAPGRARLCFLADLPPLGYHLYRLVAGEKSTQPTVPEANNLSLDNGRFRLEFDPRSGAVSSLRDLARGIEYLRGPGAMPVVYNDPSDTWSHNVIQFCGDPAGAFQAKKIECVEQGPVKTVVRVTSTYGQSSMVQEFSMFQEMDGIYVNATVDWREHHKMLKLRFPLNLSAQTATCEIPYGFLTRAAQGDEEPCQSWIDLSGTAAGSSGRIGLSLLNDGKYSFDSDGSDLGLTILRSPIFAHHDPVTPDPNQLYAYIDQGRQTFQYIILPHAGSWQDAGVVRRAAELNQPPTALVTTTHPGKLPHSAAFAAVQPDNLVVSAIKQAEESQDIIVRCYETNGVAVRGQIELPAWNRTIRADFGPCEIKTFRIPVDPASPIMETNLLEQAA